MKVEIRLERFALKSFNEQMLIYSLQEIRRQAGFFAKVPAAVLHSGESARMSTLVSIRN